MVFEGEGLPNRIFSGRKISFFWIDESLMNEFYKIQFQEIRSKLPTSFQDEESFSTEKEIFIDIAADTGQISRYFENLTN